MANLTQQEFIQAVSILADELGLQRLRDRFVKLNGLVTRRRATSVGALADQIYMLTSGLRRQVPATLAFHTIWTEQVTNKIGEDGEKALEEAAKKINECLGERDEILPDKDAQLEDAMREYEQLMMAAVGPERARLDMLLKAVSAVATKLRTMPTPPPAPEKPAAPASESTSPPADDAAD